MDKLDHPLDFKFICKINSIIGGEETILRAGYLREFGATIGGTSWVPKIPVVEEVLKEIDKILTIESVTDRSISLMLYLMRSQLFNDGNKRTAMYAANHIMVGNGKGVISVPNEFHGEFKKKLVSYYETSDMSDIKSFIYDNCIDGIHFNN